MRSYKKSKIENWTAKVREKYNSTNKILKNNLIAQKGYNKKASLRTDRPL
jgi:hypothetical protein